MTAASLQPSAGDLVTVAVTSLDDAVRVVVRGEVDASSAPTLREALDDVLDGVPAMSGGPGAVIVIDLCAVTFLDSAGLSVLAGAHRRAAPRGARLRVLAAGRPVVRPLQITGLWDLLGAELVEPGAGSVA